MRRVERCKKANDVAEPARADATLAWDSGRLLRRRLLVLLHVRCQIDH